MSVSPAKLAIAMLVFFVPCVPFGAPDCLAQGDGSSGSVTSQTTVIEGSSSSSTAEKSVKPEAGGNTSSEFFYERKGMGTPDVQALDGKYKKRLANLAEQVETGAAKGWLTADEAAKFRQELSELQSKAQKTAAAGFAKGEADDLEKSVTLFNQNLYKASNKVSQPTGEVEPIVPSSRRIPGAFPELPGDALPVVPSANPAPAPAVKASAKPAAKPAAKSTTKSGAKPAAKTTAPKKTGKK